VDVKGQKKVLYQWVVPTSSFHKDGQRRWKLESTYSHVKLGRQAAHLFEIPAGYAKVSMKP